MKIIYESEVCAYLNDSKETVKLFLQLTVDVQTFLSRLLKLKKK